MNDDNDHEHTLSTLSFLLTSYPPPFIYINDPTSLRATTFAVQSLLSTLDKTESPPIRHVVADSISCFTPRLLYDTIINGLAGWTPEWETGCSNWSIPFGGDGDPHDGGGGGGQQRWNDNFDAFLHGLRALHTHLTRKQQGQQEASSKSSSGLRLVIVLTHAERLAVDLLVPLSRLAELSQLDLTVLLISEVRWEDTRPPFGASPDPYFIDMAPPTKEFIHNQLLSNYPKTSQSHPVIYPPTLQPLYSQFISLICDVCYPFTRDPHELQYIAAARWPGYVQPILDQERQSSSDSPPLEPLPPLPSEDTRMRLNRLFTPSLRAALDALLPRLMSASEWARKNAPPPHLGGALFGNTTTTAAKNTEDGGGGSGVDNKPATTNANALLPRISKFIIIASFLASTNPAKSDLRMFGRGLDEKHKRKRRRKAMRVNTGSSSVPAKIPQRLVGPTPFSLDRMLAILGALLEENDADTRVKERDDDGRFQIPGEYTDMEVSRSGIYAAVIELTHSRLLHRTTPADRLDGPPMFKCGVGYEVALGIAKELGIALGELMWDPM